MQSRQASASVSCDRPVRPPSLHKHAPTPATGTLAPPPQQPAASPPTSRTSAPDRGIHTPDTARRPAARPSPTPHPQPPCGRASSTTQRPSACVAQWLRSRPSSARTTRRSCAGRPTRCHAATPPQPDANPTPTPTHLESRSPRRLVLSGKALGAFVAANLANRQVIGSWPGRSESNSATVPSM